MAVNISKFRIRLKAGETGRFRMLNVGEVIEAADVIVADTYFDFPSEKNIGGKVEKSDCLVRFEFNPK